MTFFLLQLAATAMFESERDILLIVFSSFLDHIIVPALSYFVRTSAAPTKKVFPSVEIPTVFAGTSSAILLSVFSLSNNSMVLSWRATAAIPVSETLMSLIFDSWRYSQDTGVFNPLT